MQELIIIFMLISVLELLYIFQSKGRYERLLSSYKSIGLVLVESGLMPRKQYEESIENRR